MSNLEIKTITRSEFDLWDSFVDRSPQGTIFHKTFWLEFFNLPFKILGCFRHGELLAGIPLVYSNRFGINYICHPKLTPYLGIIFKDNSDIKYVSRISLEKEVSQELINVFINEADVINMRFVPFPFDLQPFIWAGFTLGVKYTYILDVSDLDLVLKEMDTRRRKEINKATRIGINVSCDNNLNDFIQLVKMTFDRQNMKLPISEAELLNMHKILQRENASKVFVARDENGVACGGLYIVYNNKTAYGLMSGFNTNFDNTGAVALTFWEAFKYISNVLRLNKFDFSGSDIFRIERSLREYGGNLIPYFTVYRADNFTKLKLYCVDVLNSIFLKNKNTK